MIGNENLLSFELIDEIDVNLKIRNYKLTINVKDSEFNFMTLFKISRKIRSFVNNYSLNKEIIITINTNEIIFSDFSLYMLFESLLYFLCKNSKFKKIKFKNKKSKVFLENDLENSIVFRNINNFITREEYMKEFEKLNISLTNFRKIVKYEKDNNEITSILYSELNVFLKTFKIQEYFKEQFIETIVELVSNANEHAKVDCLLDIRIDDVVNKITEKDFYNISVSIINFSNVLLGSGIRKNFKNKNIKIGFLKELEIAYKNHSYFFNEEYTEDDFFNISAFQWRFSGRNDIIEDNGGTGLTTLIRFLIEASELDSCYVFSGNTFIIFKKEFLVENEKKYIGFNKEQNYLNYPPDSSCVLKLPFFLNGTLYNFNFIVSKEEEYE